MNHAVLGAGGLGGFLAAALARSGQPVTLIVRPEALNRYPGTITVQSRVLGDFTVPVHVSSEIAQPTEVLWVTVKATQLDAALASIPRTTVADTMIVTLLNGFEHVALLRAEYGTDRVTAGTIRIESERAAPGRIRQLSPFAVMGLALNGASGSRVRALAEEVRRAGIACEVVDDENSLLWRKLAFLAPLALTTTAKGAPVGEVREDPDWSARLEGCKAEACAVAALEGAQLDCAAVLDLLKSLPAGTQSSMQKDVAAGRPPELDAIGGAIVRAGKAHGFDVPITAELIAMISGGAP